MRPNPTPAAHGGRLRLTSEGLAWLAAGAVLGLLGWAKSLNLLLMLAYVMFALVALNGVLARWHANRLRATRLPSPPVFPGETATFTTVVRNVGSRPATAVLQNRGKEWPIDALAPGCATAYADAARFDRRGRAALPALVVGSGFPFGLLRFDRIESAGDAVLVLPRPGQAEPEGLRRWVLRMAGVEGRSRKVLRRMTHDLADVRGVRPYRPGDSLRAVHWRSSARRRELMVREYDAAPSPELILVVEPWLPAAPSERDRANLEAALSLAATVALTWCRSIATRITVVVAGSSAEPASGPASEEFLREALAPLGETTGITQTKAPDVRTFARWALRAARVIVSSRANTPLADSLARELGKPFIAMDPNQRLPWYQPPVPDARGDS